MLYVYIIYYIYYMYILYAYYMFYIIFTNIFARASQGVNYYDIKRVQ